ncbi:hypothetical protein HWV62_19863 [Athelia sp. TMB]|nr:hypothetical protein HWV62_19863 [Athelia sp. TMB]
MSGASASRLVLRNVLSRNARNAPRYGLRALHSATDAKKSLADKYAEKLEQAAKECEILSLPFPPFHLYLPECSPARKGLSVSALAAQAQDELRAKQRAEAAARAEASAARLAAAQAEAAAAAPKADLALDAINATRKDSSPVKVGTPTSNSPPLPPSSASSVQPLSAIMNLPRICATPHTADQIAALWTAYHVSRSGGTGKGYICASFPLPLYEQLTGVARKYPAFVVPVPRARDGPPAEGEEDTAYEFYFLQWDFHEPPPAPSAVEDLFAGKAKPSTENPPIATILLTPLQEYKMRASYATPYMVLTFYTDLASTHGTVLMRGEITPAGASAVPGAGAPQGSEGRHMLSQEDAQLLAMEVQKFYLWSEGGKESEAQRLLRVFHETPEEFKWEDLLKHAKLGL